VGVSWSIPEESRRPLRAVQRRDELLSVGGGPPVIEAEERRRVEMRLEAGCARGRGLRG
jgi:hypothetical protein